MKRVARRSVLFVVNKRSKVWIVWFVGGTFFRAENLPRFGNKSVENVSAVPLEICDAMDEIQGFFAPLRMTSLKKKATP